MNAKANASNKRDNTHKQKNCLDKELIRSRILMNESYDIIVKDTYKHFKISDKIVCFFNGRDWNIILLDVMLAYPILYFDYWSKKDNIIYNQSLVVCPITLRSMIYKGRIQILDIVNDRLYLINTDTGDEFFMDSPYTGHYDDDGKEKKIKSHVKRHEVKLLILRDAFMFLIDPKYIILKDESIKSTVTGLIDELKQRPIINEHYYLNRLTYDNDSIHTTFHPKTIVYIVQYYSHNMKRYKYSAIIGRDINRDTITGFSYKFSGTWEFINKHMDEFVKKKAYVYPVFWFMVEKLYPEINLIYIV